MTSEPTNLQTLSLPTGGNVSWILSPEGLQQITVNVLPNESVAPIPPVQHPELAQELGELNQAVHQAFLAYLDGQQDSFSTLPLAPLKGSPFQLAVWHTLQHVPYGETVSYSWLADRLANTGVSKPGAVRAVGQALAKNPLPIVLPCHRVLTQTGKLGGYMGAKETDATPALDLKRWLLNLEGKHKVFTPKE